MKTIDNDIKANDFKQVYLLYGEETYLLRQYKDKLKNAITAPDDSMNFSQFEGTDINVDEVISIADTLPFFANRRLILVENSGLFKKNGDALSEYLPTLPETTHIIFAEQEVDARTKLFKTAKKCGNAVEFKRQTGEILGRWIESRLKKNGKKITKEAYTTIVSKVGEDMESIDKELEKLICYTLEKEVIEASDVDAVITEHIEDKIFDMVDAVSYHNQKLALDYYYDLLALHEASMQILVLLTKHFKRLLDVKNMTARGFSNTDIASNAGCPPFAVKKYQAQSRSFSEDRLKQAISDGVQYEEAIKTGRMNEQIAVELFIMTYSNKQ